MPGPLASGRLGDVREKPKIDWGTYLLAALWAVFGIVTAWVVPPFREMFEEMRDFSTGASPPPPFWTRVVVGTPSAVWVGLGFLVAAGLIWKSKLVSRGVADWIDAGTTVAWFLAGMGVVVALFLPLIRLE
jgi:hypothetical protein